MAGIDKIYGTQRQYMELRDWLLENEVPIICEISSDYNDENTELLPSAFLLSENGFNENYRPIANFLPEMDEWLMENCPIDFVQKRLKEQYG